MTRAGPGQQDAHDLDQDPPEAGGPSPENAPEAASRNQGAREQNIDAMEQRLLAVIRREIRNVEIPNAGRRMEEVFPAQAVVAKVLLGIPRLNDKEFDVWLTLVDDALLGSGMEALSRVSACLNDALANQADVREVHSYPAWMTNTAWSAIRRAIGTDSVAFARTMSLRTGDVLALLRSLRAFYGRRAVPLLTQLRKDLIKTSLSDFPEWKHYVSALDIIFMKLAALGEVVPDQVKRFHLLEGLGEEYHSIISSVLAYEAPGGGPADYNKAVEIISAYEDNFASRRRKRVQETTMIAGVSSQHRSQGDAPKRTRRGGEARPRTGTREPCVHFLRRGRCDRGDRCLFRHVDPPLKHLDRQSGGDRPQVSTNQRPTDKVLVVQKPKPVIPAAKSATSRRNAEGRRTTRPKPLPTLFVRPWTICNRFILEKA